MISSFPGFNLVAMMMSGLRLSSNRRCHPRGLCFLRSVVGVTSEQKPKRRILFLRNPHNSLGCFLRVSRLLAVIVTLSSCGRADR
jgi:hypothetical protein